jgi:SAM-dependent methyltransferase
VTTALFGASPSGDAPVPAAGSPYWSFYDRVAAAQLADWLPTEPCRVLDLSAGPDDRPDPFAAQMRAAGHEVVRVLARPGDAEGPADDVAVDGLPVVGLALPAEHCVVADPRGLGWLRTASVDAVVAESRTLSMCLAAEVTVAELHRVLRPGGRLLLVVDSLASGLARLAEQGRWAELADVPSADVLLVPEADGSITRCFWPEELSALLAEAGFAVDWVRPRSVLTPGVVERALAEGGEQALRLLVRTECALAEEREGESLGLHLVASARRTG